MPIEIDGDVRRMAEDEFLRVAYAVTGAAFALHKEYGVMFSERLYKLELAAECQKLGFDPVSVELPIHVLWGDFRKDYFVDLLVAGGALFELKVLAELVEAHRAQTLNYLFLTGLERAKLFNLGAPSVQHEFVSTKLTPALRRRMNVDTQRWSDTGPASVRFRQLLLELLDDWGLFLEIPLYYRALTHFFGGPEQVIREIPILRDERHVTTQRAHLLDPANAFKLTALDTGQNTVEEHLHRFLRHTELDAIHWVNLYHHEVRFVTIRRKN